MKAAEVISSLKARGVQLWQEGGALRYKTRLGTLSDKEKAILRAHRNAILRALADSPTVPIAAADQPHSAATTAAKRPSSRTVVNREAMPQIAAAVGQLRKVFGPVQVIFASEGGKELGREPPPGIKPVITAADAPKRTARKEGRS